MKIPTFGLKVFVLVVVRGCFGLSFEEYCWLVLVWIFLRNVCKREMLGFQRKCCQKFIKTPVLVWL